MDAYVSADANVKICGMVLRIRNLVYCTTSVIPYVLDNSSLHVHGL